MKLETETEAKLRHAIRTHKEGKVVRNVRILIALGVPGATTRSVAQAQLLSRKTVMKVLSLFKTGGVDAVLSYDTGRGRPALAESARARVMELLATSPRPTLRSIADQTGVSYASVWNLANPPEPTPRRGR